MDKLIKKTSLLLLACVAAFAFTGCGGDDDPPALDNALVGTWEIVESYEEIYVDGGLAWSGTNGMVGTTIVLGQDGRVTWNSWNIGTWAVSGSTFYMTYIDGDDLDMERYTLTRESNSRVTLKNEEVDIDDGRAWRLVETFTMERVGSSSGSENYPGDGGPDITDPGSQDGISPAADAILGSWQLVSGYEAYYSNGLLNGWESYGADDLGDIYTLYEGGVLVVTDGLEIDRGTWSLDGSTITLRADGDVKVFKITGLSDGILTWCVETFGLVNGVTVHAIESQTFQRVG